MKNPSAEEINNNKLCLQTHEKSNNRFKEEEEIGKSPKRKSASKKNL